jgi:hypothetical protein
VLLHALATPLYRVLEGYLLWPRRLQISRINSHISKRTHPTEASDDGSRTAAGLRIERLAG